MSSSRQDQPQAAPPWTNCVAWFGLALVVLAPLWIPFGGFSQRSAGLRTHRVTRGDLLVTVTEEGTLESANNREIKCKVRGESTVIWVIESGTYVEPGDELVRLDALAIEEAISERTKYSHWSRSSAERSAADVVRSELAISEYLEGRFRTELMTLEKDLTIAKSNELTAQNILTHTETMADRGYVSGLDVEEGMHARTRAHLNVDVTKKQIEVLEQYTKAMELETLKGELNEAKARHAANAERAILDETRRVLAVEELGHCVMKAERSGLVVYPSLARWKNAPEIEEGATVHKDQVLLLMPDLSKMQVEVGIHESIVDRVKPGMSAQVRLAGKNLQGEVTSVAAVARPAGWWTGSVVKYDTIVSLAAVPSLKPGMSAEVEIRLKHYEKVLLIPVAAILQTSEGNFCWVVTAESVYRRRPVRLGDSDDKSIVVESGLQEGEEVVLDPLANVVEAQSMAMRPASETEEAVNVL